MELPPGDEGLADPDDGPLDPLAEASPRRLRRLARRADQLRRRRPDGLHELADSVQVPIRQLRLLGDAWAEGGASGVEALGPAFATPQAHMDAAADALERWRAKHHPLEAVRWDIWRNRITVWWLVPDVERNEVERRPLLQLRLTHDGRWHLYHRAAHGEWWPVVVRGPREHQSVEDALSAVERDAGNRFWSGEGAAPPPGDR
jgi:hypothetical protein